MQICKEQRYPIVLDYKHILIILPERLGDTIFHTPSIRLLKTMRPDISIGVLALSPLSASVVENNPYIDDIHVQPSAAAINAMANHYDVVLNVHNHKGSREHIKQLGIKTLTELPPDPSIHQSAQALKFVQGLLECEVPSAMEHYDLHPTTVHFEKIDRLLLEHGVHTGGDILIGCHIGCHSMAKQRWSFWGPKTHKKAWPLEHFVALEAALRKVDKRFRFVLTGSNSEKVLARKFRQFAPTAIDLVDRTSVLDLAALMDRLPLFLTSDTGALHVACARNTGIVALFGPTQALRTGPHPLQNHHRILHSTTTMSDITAEQVGKAILDHPNIARLLGGDGIDK